MNYRIFWWIRKEENVARRRWWVRSWVLRRNKRGASETILKELINLTCKLHKSRKCSSHASVSIHYSIMISQNEKSRTGFHFNWKYEFTDHFTWKCVLTFIICSVSLNQSDCVSETDKWEPALLTYWLITILLKPLNVRSSILAYRLILGCRGSIRRDFSKFQFQEGETTPQILQYFLFKKRSSFRKNA